jgi:serine-type D-Ala-D-Ala carboxypeptidase (penicillin-binding protein 5/6)
MNARGRSLRLGSTRYADASGADPATVSTVGDQFRLTLRALQIPGFRQIVAMPRVMLPVAGLAYNVNSALGHDGIVGVKTGSSSQAGGCLAFAAIRAVAGSPVTIVGVVLGVRATAARPSALGGVIAVSENLPGHCHGEAPSARAHDQPGPARGPGHRHDRRRRPPHHPARQPGRAGTVGALAAHPAMIRPGALSCPRGGCPG